METETAANPVAAIRRLLPQCMLQDRVRLGRRLKRQRGKQQLSAKELERLKEQAEKSARLLDQRRHNLPRPTYPQELPISAKKDEILQAVRQHPVVIVAGETGSGKTTQLPKICLEAGRGVEAKIACTQPRRVAALSVSQRIAEELGVEWGRQVGCKIRFTDQTAPETSIKMMTDGMLLAEVQNDRQLFEYDTIIVDEAHERSLNIDFLLGHLKLLCQQRPDLKVIITSATIDTEAFSKAFGDAPVIEVSGRMYPVEVRYWPIEELLSKDDDLSYIDAVVRAVENITTETRQGDILVFLPSESDIHEVRSLLEGRHLRSSEILPLFGRLTTAEQQRVFAPQGQRRIVVATNIAETSLTIPNIRYVIDTGLARLSRFNPRNQTQRLPIEAISQSSAEQRKGRCGRVMDGICIRLYSEEDFLARPHYTQPEIQRANLADVILRMMAARLGDVETFPFIDPPTSQAIHGGYLLLKELGALDAQHRLTKTGRAMARLPIACTDARMILQAKEEGALREVLIIAAAISIQDPRERPLDHKEEADRTHRQFVDRRSDFLTLLKIWNTYHDQWEQLRSQSQMRKFCRNHFLSYMRMREWRDIHFQLSESLREIGDFAANTQDADYDAIHRSIVTGLFSNIARKKEHNIYQAARGREVMIFPGSGLFERRAEQKKNPADKKDPTDRSKTPQWLVAGEVVETSRLFARTVAAIAPTWLAELAAHLCSASHKDPFWNARSGRVLITETLHLYGLEVLSQRIPYNRIDAHDATDIFIRHALVEYQVHTPHAFLQHNQQLCEKIETWQTRIRSYEGIDVDTAAFQFYRDRLDNISSVHDLNGLIRQKRTAEPQFLHMSEQDLLGARDTTYDLQSFPQALTVDGAELPLAYAYQPGQEEDGITVKMPYKLLHAIDPQMLDWLVPGFLEEKITYLLRSLPKSVRKQFVPIPQTTKAIAADLKPTHPSLLEALENFIQARYRVHIQRADWTLDNLPDHLNMRIEVHSNQDQSLVVGRNLEELTQRLERHDTPVEMEAWNRAAAQWVKSNLEQWTFGDLPAFVEVAQVSGVPLYGYPGLEPGQDGVTVRLFKSREEAEQTSRHGLTQLYELNLSTELAWLQRQLQDLEKFKDLYRSLGTAQELRAAAFAHLECYLFARQEVFPLLQSTFIAGLEGAKELLQGLAPRFIDLVENLLKTRREIQLSADTYAERDADLERLVCKNFLQRVPYTQLPHLCRYLKAVQVRAERARLNPQKEIQKAQLIRPYQEKLDALMAEDLSAHAPRQQLIEELRWMMEEYRVSAFAQELGTAHPISPKRLDKKLEEIAKQTSAKSPS